MFGAILKATNSSFQKGMIFCCSIYVKKVMKLLAFIFEQPSYTPQHSLEIYTLVLLIPILSYQGLRLSNLTLGLTALIFSD